MKKIISLMLAITVLFGTITCVGFQSSALNPSAQYCDPIALDGTVVNGTVESFMNGCAYRTDIPEEGYLEIYVTYYAPLRMVFEDVWCEDVIDSYYYSSEWKAASADNPVTVRYTYSAEPGAQIIRMSTFYNKPGGDFSLSVIFTPYCVTEIEDNNIDESSRAKACPVKIGQAMVGSFIPGDVFDYYEFSVTENVRLTTNFTYCLPLNYVRIMKKNNGGAQGKVYLHKALGKASFEKPAVQTVSLDLPKGSYYLQVAAVNEARGKYSFTLNAEKPLPVPTGFKVITRKTDRQTVSWNVTKGVSGYQVQCSDGGTAWKYTKTGTKTSASFTGLTAGGRYKFRLRTYVVVDGKKKFGNWTKTLSSCAKPATAKIKAISTPKKGQIKTTWLKAGGVVSGYQIQFSKDKAFKQIVATKTIKTDKTLSYTGLNLTSRRTYYVRVRAYTVFNGNFYGAWSAAKAVKVR